MTPKNLSEQTLAVPSGAGSVSSAGQTFQGGGYTGGGSYSIPIATPPGHAGLGPALALGYDMHGGSGLAGLGWGLSLASIERRIDRGIPSFDDDADTFVLQGDELVPLPDGMYRFRIETRFARIQRVQSETEDYWVVTERDGTRVFYGEDADHQLRDDFDRIAAWYPSRKRDVHGNEVIYAYTRDPSTFDVRLTTVSWAGCYRVSLAYEARPDPIWSARRGFPHVQDQRLASISLEVKRTSDSSWFTFREYALGYTTSALTGRSLLTTVTVTCSAPAVSDRTLPGLTFGYTEGFGDREWVDVEAELPPGPLSDANVTLVRQSGSGLPDILASTEGSHWLWVNRGDATFDPPVRVPAPVAAMLAEERAFISDMTGDGWGDLVVAGGAQVFHARAGGGWSSAMIKGTVPTVDLRAPDVRVLDLNGDGIPDALRLGANGATYFENLGDGHWSPGIRIARSPPCRLDDPRTQLVDINGDGLPDLVCFDRGRIEVWPGLGRGRFGEPFLLENAPSFGSDFDPRKVRWADLTGSGQADLLYVENGRVTVYLNQAGVALADGVEVSQLQLGSIGHVEPTDLRGNGASGLLFTDRGRRRAWRYLDLFPEGSPDLLKTIDNGIGGTTVLQYGSSAAHWKRDKEALDPWKTHMPFVRRVVDQVLVTDETTGLAVSMSFAYHHGVYDGVEREFRGFGRVEQYDTETDPDAEDPLVQAMIRRWFHCGTDLDLTDEYAALTSAPLPHTYPVTRPALRSLRGLLVREETYAVDDLVVIPYKVTESGYTVYAIEQGTDGQWSHSPLPTAARTTVTERTTEERIVTTTMTYDLDSGPGYGLPVEVRTLGTGRATTDSTAVGDQQAEDLERYTTTTYLDALDDADTDFSDPTYLVGKVAQVERHDGVDELLARELFFYDGDDFEGKGYPGSATMAGLVAGDKGLLKAHLVLALTDDLVTDAYPSGSGVSSALSGRGEYVVDGTDHCVAAERHQYTSEGLVAVFRDPRGNDLTLTYDSTYDLFPVAAEDAAGHPTTLTRGELPFQVAEVVDANANHTTFGYDATGLPAWKAVKGKEITSGNWEGDDETYPTESYGYDFTIAPIQVVVESRQVRHGATLDVYRYIDGVGRTLQERHTAEPDPGTPTTPRFRVTGWIEYNQKGQPYREFQPSFSDTSDYDEPTDTPYIETRYDAPGRPIRVEHPDGTFESTDYHPWVQTASDRNDNAEGISDGDSRYGAYRHTFRSHLETPTKKYVDAFGRDIAVAEDNGAAPAQTFRIATYTIAAGAFTGATYDLTLTQNLATNYFMLIHGVVDNGSPDASSSGVRVTHDPNGTGDLSTSLGPAVIRLTRGSASGGDWVGTVVVWESLGDPTASGFTLLDVKTVSASSTASGTEQTTTTTTGTPWATLAQVALYGGIRGGGATATSATSSEHHALHGKLTASGTDTLELSRWRPSGTLPAADFTVYVVEWGSDHRIQHVTVTGTASGDGIDATGEYTTAALAVPVRRSQSWAWMSGWTKTSNTGDSFAGLALNLGDGPEAGDDYCTEIAIGAEFSADRSIRVTVHSHPDLLVHWIRKDDGDSGATNKALTAATAGETETVAGTSTLGLRAPIVTSTAGTNNTRFDESTIQASHTAARTITLTRPQSGMDWVSWAQSIDTVGVTYKSADDPAIHVTRTVLDLRDQPIEVWDARDLADPTWIFEYDYAARRLTQEHTTGAGKRWVLPDAANNPVWSRDARDIEVDRTFDALNRPLTESSTESSTTKLRRAWNYLEYDDTDPGFAANQAINLYGQLEEERDSDGLRFFEYDWRGLPTKVSSRFWDVYDDWTSGLSDVWDSTWDPATPSTARGSITTWLVLTDLSDTTTIEVATSFDAAGRPVEVTYPEGMRTQATYNAAGLVDTLELDRGSGYATVMEEARYNARAQPISHLAGNGVLTAKEYDPDIERLLRIFTKLPGSPDVRMQDQNYAYDPVGNPVQITDALAESTFTDNQVIPNTRTFRYDPRYRLSRATGKRHSSSAPDKTSDIAVPTPTWGDYEPYTIRYSYDEVGNFTTNQEYKSGTNNLHYKDDRIDLFNGDTSEAIDDDPAAGNYTYDENGNTLKTPRIAELVYTHDDQARFVDMGGGGVIRYARHADQRVLRFVNKTGVKSVRIYLGPFEYERRTGATAYTKLTLHCEGSGLSCQAEVVLDGTDATSLPRFWRHQDHLSSGQILTKEDSTLLSQEEYYPYGRPSDRRDSRNRYRYIGVERDEDTGLCMTGPRTYDPVIGRFLQQDPLAPSEPGLVRYAYSRAQPKIRLDPTGYDDPTSVEVKTGPENRKIVVQERKADADALAFADALLKPPEDQPKNIPVSKFLERQVEFIDRHVKLDDKGREHGGIYYVTRSGREGFIYVGAGPEPEAGERPNMASWLGVGADLLPDDVRVAVSVHGHPKQDNTSYGAQSTEDAGAFLRDSRLSGAIVVSDQSGLNDSRDMGPGMTMLVLGGTRNAVSTKFTNSGGPISAYWALPPIKSATSAQNFERFAVSAQSIGFSVYLTAPRGPFQKVPSR